MVAAAAVVVGAVVDLPAVAAVAWVEIQAVAVVVDLHPLATLPCHLLVEIDCCLLDSRSSAAWERRTLAAVAVAADCCC